MKITFQTVGAVLLCTFALVTDAVAQPDVEFFGVTKAQHFDQDNPNVVRLRSPQSPLEFQVFIDTTGENKVTSATLVNQFGTNVTFQPMPDENSLRFEKGYDSLLDLDTEFANGNYTLTINAVNDGTKVINLTLSGDSYPNPPKLTAASYNAAQAQDAESSLTLQWGAFTGGTVNDFIQVTVEDEFGNSVFETDGPGEGLDGTDTSVVIPANRFAPGRRYEAQIMFAKLVQQNTQYGNGVVGVAAYLKFSHFHVFTTGGTDSTPPFLTRSMPYSGQIGVPRHSSIAFHFSEAMNTASPASSIQWVGTGVSFTYTWSTDGKILYATPTGLLPADTQIGWTLNPVGNANIQDLANNILPISMGQFTTGNQSEALDVEKVVISKGQGLRQTGSSAPIASGDFAFELAGDLTGLNTVKAGSLQLPSGGLVFPENDFMGTTFDYSAEYASKTDMDLSFPSGGYTLVINAANNGTKTIGLTIPSDDYPNDPTVTSLTSLQSLNASGPITINWGAFSGAAANDVIQVYIENDHGMDVLDEGSIPGTATSTTIPANTLSPGRKYSARLTFAKVKVADTSSYAGVPIIFAFGKETQFTIQTGGSPIPAELEPPDLLNPGLIAVNADRFWVYTLEASQDLSFWAPVETRGTSSDGFLLFYDGDSQYNSRRFYRVREPLPFEFTQRYVAIQGTVRRQDNSQPIAGATISTSLDGRTVVSGADGTFFLQTETAGDYSTTPYTITVTKSGFFTFSLNLVWGAQPRNQTFLLSPNGGT